MYLRSQKACKSSEVDFVKVRKVRRDASGQMGAKLFKLQVHQSDDLNINNKYLARDFDE